MASNAQNCVLYHHYSSICSIMVRYCYALRGPRAEDQQDILIEEESVDIFHEAQLSEHYLCDINPYGEVPVLAPVPVQPGTTIPDSLRITLYLAKHFTNMIPASYHDTIYDLLYELHAINYYSLTFTGRPETVIKIQDAVQDRMAGNISERYRNALQYKLDHMESSRVHALEPESVEKNHELAINLLNKLRPSLQGSESGWLFGFDAPSALDAHLVVFLARMRDIGRKDLYPDVFQEYLERATQGVEWSQIQQGTTKPPMS